MNLTVIGPAELRSSPGLLDELRNGTPSGAVERRFVGPDADGVDPVYRGNRLELRAESGDGYIYRGGGLGIVYNSRSVNLGGFIEVIRPGAARDVLARQPDVRALVNHDPNLILGRTLAGTLALDEREDGVDYLFDAPDTSYSRDLGVSMARGDITQSSFAFRVAPDGVEWDEDPDTGLLLRVIHRFSALLDMSPVTYPAYPTATSGLRAAEEEAGDEDARSPGSYGVRHRRLRLRERTSGL